MNVVTSNMYIVYPGQRSEFNIQIHLMSEQAPTCYTKQICSELKSKCNKSSYYIAKINDAR